MSITTMPDPTAAGARTTRRLTGLTPSAHLQLGNLLGAIRPLVDGQDPHAAGPTTGQTPPQPATHQQPRTHQQPGMPRTETIAFISDLHAMTANHDPRRLRAITMEHAGLLLAAGLDPDRSILFAQSQIRAHAELHYLLECVASYGEAHRMIQFKEKSARQSRVRLSLLTYPVLMAADILAHDIDEVPIGEDQSQHMELARDVAIRFNGRYGKTFVVPRGVKPPVAGRIMDLTDPTRKMSKTGTEPGTLFLLDPPDTIRRKVMRAVSDSGAEVRYDPPAKPGISNLLAILAAGTRDDPARLATDFTSYAAVKAAVVDAVCELLRPLQERYGELSGDPAYVRAVLAAGAQRAQGRAEATVRRAKQAIGLISG